MSTNNMTADEIQLDDDNLEATSTFDWDSVNTEWNFDSTEWNFDNFDPFDMGSYPEITGGGDLTGLDMSQGTGSWMGNLSDNIGDFMSDIGSGVSGAAGGAYNWLTGSGDEAADANSLSLDEYSALSENDQASYREWTKLNQGQQELSNAQEARQTLNPLTWNAQTWISLLGLGYGIYAAEERKDAYERANDPTRMGTNAAQQQIAYRTAMNAAGMGTTSGGGSSSSGGGAAVPSSGASNVFR